MEIMVKLWGLVKGFQSFLSKNDSVPSEKTILSSLM